MTGDRQVRTDIQLSRPVRRGVRALREHLGERRHRHAAGPEDGASFDSLGPCSVGVLQHEALLVDLLHHHARLHLYASLESVFAALRERSSGNGGSTRGAPSTRRIRASSGWIERKSFLKVSRAISPIAPASSTPVGPAPTMTNVNQSRRRAGSERRSATSKA